MSIPGATAWNSSSPSTGVPSGATAATVTVSACAGSEADRVSSPVQVNVSPGSHRSVGGVANVAAHRTTPLASASTTVPPLRGNTQEKLLIAGPESVTSDTRTWVSASVPSFVIRIDTVRVSPDSNTTASSAVSASAPVAWSSFSGSTPGEESVSAWYWSSSPTGGPAGVPPGPTGVPVTDAVSACD